MPQLVPDLNIVGCGRVARSLGRLWSRTGVFRLGDLASRSESSARDTQSFAGGGRVVRSIASMRPAAVWLVATPDGALEEIAEELAQSAPMTTGNCVFHCSGARSHALLAPLAKCGAELASAHPVLSFASPERACEGFPGTQVGVEGSPVAVAMLTEAFSRIGARCFPIDPQHKLLYHAGSVFASNFTVVLLDLALRAYQAAGLDPETAGRILRPLVEGAIGNALRLGPGAALSGPAARGDLATVRDQQRCVSEWAHDPGLAYEVLSRLAAELAARNREEGP